MTYAELFCFQKQIKVLVERKLIAEKIIRDALAELREIEKRITRSIEQEKHYE